MNYFFDKISISNIQFETGSMDVNVQCVITQQDDTYKSELVMSHSDLNRLIGKIQQEQEIDILNQMDSFEIEEGHLIYSINFDHYGHGFAIENFSLNNECKQIRA